MPPKLVAVFSDLVVKRRSFLSQPMRRSTMLWPRKEETG